MIIPRRLTAHLKQLAEFYPIISLTGPRQAGKTTLLSRSFKGYRYVSLEAPDIRREALADPRAFLAQYDDRVIFDEVQRAPELFNYLQGIVDADRRPGRFILSGSQNFLLHRGITQSLAGRVGIARLFPFDLLELEDADQRPAQAGEAMLNGFYPNPITTGLPARFFYPDYIASYLERDVAEFINAGNRATFLLFLRVCAAFAGQLVNVSQMAKMTNVSAATINSWLSILETSYILFRVGPYFKNFGKRLVKSPKLYFYDTGLLCHLLNANTIQGLRRLNQYGPVFENLVIAERVKALYHTGEHPELYFFRDSNGLEADLLETGEGYLTLTEIKSSETFSPNYDRSIRKIGEASELPVRYRVIQGGSDPLREVAGTEYRPWYLAGQP